MDRLLITGVPGWFSDRFIHSILSDSVAGIQSIRCFVQPGIARDAAQLKNQYSPDVEIAYADLLDSESTEKALRNVDGIVHAAGVLHVAKPEDWYAINTTGTSMLVNAAVRAGVRRFVYISSNAAAGRSPSRDTLLTEADPPMPLSHYGRSKLLAERAVLKTQHCLECVIIRPCMFYGPPVPRRHIAVYERIRTRWMPLVGRGNFSRSLSYIDNLVHGCRLALMSPAAAGQTYYLSDRPVYTTKQITDAIARALGIVPRYRHLPTIVGPFAYQLDRLLTARGYYSQDLHLLGESDWNVGVSCEKARRELGYSPRIELEEGMARAVEWCRQEGLI
jgi:nucleoside-diphosphate-sugar epimerase